MKGKIILLITALVAIVLTIAIYNVAVQEWTSMIQLSLVVVCASEFAIVSTMGLFPALNYKNGPTAILITIYAVMIIIWSCFAYKFEDNTYPTGLLIISLVMLIIIGISVMSSHEADKLNDEVEQTIAPKRSFLDGTPSPKPCASSTNAPQENLSSMWLTIQSTIEDIDTKKRLKTLIERIQTLPANRFPNPTIEASMTQIIAMCRAINNTENRNNILARINNKTKELSNYIKTL